MSNEIVNTGKCLCGKLSFNLLDEPIRSAQCHCKHCQRASGTGHMSLAFYKEDQVQLSGEARSHDVTADSGNTNTRFFCPDCGSRVYSRNSARAGVIGIAVGCIDDNSWFAPNAVVYCENRADWDITSTDIPNFDQMPPPAK